MSTKELFTKISREISSIGKSQRKIDEWNAEILKRPGFENYGLKAVEEEPAEVEKAILAEY